MRSIFFRIGTEIMLNHYCCHRFIPFSGGPRKCVGDQFAMLEAIIALAIFLQHMNFDLVADQKIGMTTGATIHTTNVSSYNFCLKIIWCIFYSVRYLEANTWNLLLTAK